MMSLVTVALSAKQVGVLISRKSGLEQRVSTVVQHFVIWFFWHAEMFEMRVMSAVNCWLHKAHHLPP